MYKRKKAGTDFLFPEYFVANALKPKQFFYQCNGKAFFLSFPVISHLSSLRLSTDASNNGVGRMFDKERFFGGNFMNIF